MVLTVNDIERKTGEGCLVDPENLVVDLLLSAATDFERRRLLLSQVRLAEERGDQGWLEECAGFCFQLGFGMMSPELTEDHIGPIPGWARSNSGRPAPRAVVTSKDVGAAGISGSQRSSRPAGISSGSGVRAHSPDEEWQEVTRKKPRRWSPIEWERKKIVYDSKSQETCFKCGEIGHYARECEGQWKCLSCGGYGHRAVECFRMSQRRQREPVAGISGSGAIREGTERVEKEPARVCHPIAVKQTHEEVEVGREDIGEGATGISSGAPQEPEAAISVSGAIGEGEREVREGAVGQEQKECGKTRASRGRKPFKRCRVSWCQGNFSYKKAHAFDAHYPTALAAQEGEDTRTPLRVEVLRFLARTLVGTEATLSDLVDHLNQFLKERDRCTMDDWTTGVARDISQSLGLEAPERFTCTPLNSPGCVFQYQVWLDIMNQLSRVEHSALMKEFSKERNPIGMHEPAGISCTEGDRVRVEIRRVCQGREVSTVSSPSGAEEPDPIPQAGISGQGAEERTELELESVSSVEVKASSLSESKSSPSRRPWRHERSPQLSLSDLEVVDEVGSDDGGDRQVICLPEAPYNFTCVDSNFHLDRLCAKLRIRPLNFQKAMEAIHPLESIPPFVDSAVAVWCDPESYPSKAQVDRLRKRNVVSTLGIHPSKVRDGNVLKMEEMLDSYDVVGVGEVGLDGTHEDPHLQRLVLEEVLRVARKRPHLVLVLHCRPSRKELATHTYYELFYTCKSILPEGQKIHLHCFNGSADVVALWLGYFPNTYFGFSLMVTRADFGADSQLALARVDESRLLLETDAPYFPHREGGYEWSSPGFIGVVADAVGRVRGMRRQELLELTAANAQRLYWG